MSPRTNDGEPEPTRPASARPVPDSGAPASGGPLANPGRPAPNPGPGQASEEASSATKTAAEAKPGNPAEADTRADARADSDTVAHAGTDAEAEAGAGTDTETGAEAQAGTDTETGADVEARAETGAEAGAEAPEPDGDVGADAEVGHDARDRGADAHSAGDRGADAHGAGDRAAGTGDDGGLAVGGDERVAAVRRAGAAGRRWRAAQLSACAAMLAVALTAGAIALGAVRDGQNVPVSTAAAVSPGLLASGDLDSSITALQAHLRAQPRDFGGWATLGLAYVEQARTKGDPSRYPQAEQALKRSLSLRSDNDQALAGRAALAAARHDFANALDLADQALKQNPYNERALCSRIDALVELGRYDDAEEAAKTADERRPGVPVFTRYAYVHELRGDVTTARQVLERALAASTSPGDIAYVAAQLGQLAWNQGDYATALTHYARALAADENYLPALEGRARAQAASGQQAEAIKGLELIVARYPLPGPLVELGELYEARGGEGDAAKAENQYLLVDAWTAIARANGVNADLDTALAAADHGDRATALRAARDDWSRRHTVHTADALAWALHVNGKDAEALPYARQATATGYHNASFLYHRGVIEKATGHPADARTHLAAALKLNPGFSPLGAREARTALKTLEASK
ncbi:tetratricopeptide repeat protein [Streptomyces asoensis]|uniref:Tetratricopeptide repeat protein n=1 Tax=Streptomyces asoensis TaxID=249586 RepID=A0A6M4WNA1_9ACTN|nr:tetratricopeptide repeat protein [Streptomyces asoensis]QJT00725.1 tetratricopeptide repeat protein [Streptomyces asoensis]